MCLMGSGTPFQPVAPRCNRQPFVASRCSAVASLRTCCTNRSHRAEEPSVPQELHPSTVAVTAGRGTKQPGAPTNLPVTLTSTFHPGGERIYGRDGNPNWSALEEVLGALEGGRALVYSSGMGAISAVLERLPVGSGVVMPFDAYH